MKFKNIPILILVFLFLGIKGFSQNYTVQGDAITYGGCNCFRLNPDDNDKGGAAYQNNTINLNNSFDYTFSVFLGCNNGSGADGICFVLSNNIQALGAKGGGLGYGGLAGNSLCAEFDTYQNGGEPSYQHTALESGGSTGHNVQGPVSILPSQGNVDDCANHTVRIVWDVNAQTYKVYFDGNLRLTYSGNIVTAFFGGNPIVNWGWSGSTGGGTNEQRFCVISNSNWQAGTNYQSCSKVIQFTDISTSNVGSVQSWAWNFGEPASGAANTSTLQNPTHTYASNGTYTVSLTITDISGCTNTYSHPVIINSPITLSNVNTTPSCNGASNGQVVLTSTGGFGASTGYYPAPGYDYTWNDGAKGNTHVGLTAGTYTITSTDGVCSASTTVTLTQPSALSANTSHTDATCGNNDGTVTMTISGGTPPYNSISWNGVSGLSRTGLTPNVYVADFKDANGCSALLTYKETVLSLPCGITSSVTKTDVSCFGGSNGTATLTVTGSTGGVNVTWSPSGKTGLAVTGLPSGTQTYSYTDGNPAHAFTGSVTINAPGAALVGSLSTVNTSCSYLNNGSALMSVTANGTPPYSYAWSGGQPNAPTANGLSPGAITVTVTDNKNCTVTATGSVVAQPPIVPNLTHIDDSCYLSEKGSATVNATGGSPGYTFVWSNAAIGGTAYDLGIGTYKVTVTDVNNCTATATTTINQPPQLTYTLVKNNVKCFGGNTGDATITPAGGNGGYTYNWSNAATINNPTGLVANKYYVTAYDAKNCKVTDSVTITEPTKFVVQEDSVNVKCKGLPTGSITLTLSGGTTPYGTLTWGDGPTGLTRSNLLSNLYTYTVADGQGCPLSGDINIAEPAQAFSLSHVQTDVKCFGDATGSITLTQSGGTTPYATPQWLDLAVGITRNGLAAGTYIAIDSDANGCLDSLHILITQPNSAFAAAKASTNVLCNGGTSGTATLTLSGGTTPYGTVSWSDAGSGTSRTGLAAGQYGYTVSDANLCKDTGTIVITEPTKFVVQEDSVNVKCKGLPTGSITLTLSGGTTPYGTVTWGDGPTGLTRSNLASNLYTYTVADAKGCPLSGDINITEPAQAFSLSHVQTDVKCFGDATGSITLTQSGGTTPYATPQWLDLAVGITRNGLAAGTYIAIDSDANGCLDSLHILITQPNSAFAAAKASTNVLCNGGTSGTATLTLSGGTTPYGTVSWSDAGSGTSRTGLAAGQYGYTVSDANLCKDTGTIVITEPTKFVVQEDSVNVKCKGLPTGSITLTLSGGTTPYGTVTWGDGPTGLTRSNLASNLYTYTVADGQGCPLSGDINITEPAQAFSLSHVQTDVKCFGDATGSITLTQSGGTTPYATPQWLDLAVGITRNGLAAGTYIAIDSDANGCLDSLHILITQPNSAFAAAKASTNVLCNGGTSGTATLTLSGGTTPYGTVSWSDAGSGTSRTGLAAGQYGYTVSDANLCKDTGTIVITEPTKFVVQEDSVNVKCKGLPTGSITLTLSGGTTPYGTVTWGDGPTGLTRSNLASNLYTYTVADAKGCPLSGDINITEPAAAFKLSQTHVDVKCSGDGDGSINVTQSGGTTPYATPFWLDLVTGLTRSNLVPNTYVVVDSDANGCLDSLHILISQPPFFSAIATTTDVLCKGGATGSIQFTLSGGTTPYGTVTWGDGGSGTSRTGLVAGYYDYTVSDANGCTRAGQIVISEPSKFVVQEDSVNVKCKGLPTGSITLTLSGGTTPYGTLTWGDGPTGLTRSNLASNLYTYTVADAKGCPLSGDINITEPAQAFSLSHVQTDVKCFGDATGSITLTQSGGTTPYATPQWLDLAVGITRNGLAAGTYIAIDSDANGCLDSLHILITQPASGMVIGTSFTNASCSYKPDGSATATVTSGGSGPFTFTWSNTFTENNVTTSTATALTPNTYTVTVLDQGGCTVSASTSVGSPSAVSAQITVTDVDCFGNTNGGVSVVAGGGTGPTYNFAWSANAGAVGNNSSASSLGAATYNITVTDGNNCELDTFATVLQPATALSFQTPVTIQNVSCNGGSNGSVQYVVNGGTASYNYVWSGSAAGSNDIASNLVAGNYDVTISDTKGCSVTNSVTVTEPTALSVTTSQTNVSCNGGNNGTATVTVSGGTPTYTYVWNPSVGNLSTEGNLNAGQYDVTVLDLLSCPITASFIITEPLKLTALSSQVNVLCNGDNTGSITVNANGGTPATTGYTYNWNPNVSISNSATGIAAGSYSINVSDSLACSSMVNVTITESSAIVPAVVSTLNEPCFGDSKGEVQLGASGGTPVYQYEISSDGINFTPSPNGNSTGLIAGAYTARITDANGCPKIIPFAITEPSQIVAIFTNDSVKCFGESNGSIAATASGGSPNYTYNFSNGQTNSNGVLTSLPAGAYSVTVSDSKGCFQVLNTIVYQPDSLELIVNPTDATINLGQSVQLQAASNYSAITYQWSPSYGLSCTDCDAPVSTTYQSITYTLTGTVNPNGKACTATIKIPVTVIPNYNMYIPNAFTPNGDGVNDYFEIFGNKAALKFVEVQIFNRWGEKVFDSNDINFKWDGVYKGVQLNPGTFVYQIKAVFLDNHSEDVYKGSLLLLR